MDCVIDTKIKNKKGLSALDLCEHRPEIALLILEHQPVYFKELLRQGRIDEAEIIAKSINASYFKESVEGDIFTLEYIMSNRALKPIALVALRKIDKIKISNLLHLFVENYADTDIDVLRLILKTNPNLVGHKEQEMFAADIALRYKKYNILSILLNNGSTLSCIEESKLSPIEIDNINIILKAAKGGIKIDFTDFQSRFNYDKTDNDEGNTVFHLMCKNKDQDIFKYQDLLRYCLKMRNNKNSEGKNICDLAIEADFIELIELLYMNQELYDHSGRHKLAKTQEIQDMSKLLKHYKVEITIKEARLGINLKNKVDENGNTLLQALIKKYITKGTDKISGETILKEITTLLKMNKGLNEDYINYTARPDGNTALHLAVMSGNREIINLLAGKDNISRINPFIINTQGLTALELGSDLYNSDTELRETFESIKKEKEYNHNLEKINNLKAQLLEETELCNLPNLLPSELQLYSTHFENILSDVLIIGEM